MEADYNQEVILDIIFWKTAVSKRRRVNDKELIDTYCRVSRVMYSDRPMTLITEAKALHNPLDTYNKIVGKKVALTKAIANIPFLKIMGKGCVTYSRRKIMRKHIWEVFHQTFGRWN